MATKKTSRKKRSIKRRTTKVRGAKKTARKKPSRKAQGVKTAKALAGKTGRGTEFDPSHELPEAMAAGLAEIRQPRPYSSRYPIPEEEFRSLKKKADRVRLPAGGATHSKDAGQKAEIATRGVVGLEALAPQMAAAPPAEAPSPTTNFAGISATGWIPPDCTMATGPSHVLLSVNSTVAIYAKSGGPALLQRTLTAWFSNIIQGATVFDPKALYDQQAGRWVLLAAAVGQNPNRSAYLLSVSASSDPLGQWRNYLLNAMVNGTSATNNWADYPSLGVDSNALYITSNQFAFGGNFQYAKIRVVPKAGPYSGGVATFFDFVGMRNANNSLAFTIQPCHTFGAPQVEYLVNSMFPSGNSLTVWRIAPSGASFSLTRTSVTTAAYSLPPNAAQKGNNDPLNSGDVRVLNAVFRGDSIWCALTTTHSWVAGSSQAAIHWFQIRAAAPALVQQGVFGAARIHYFYPACCPDNNGNMIMVFSRASDNEFGSVYYTGRRATDPLGALQASALLKAGVANYVAKDDGGRNRWGDYAGIASDPANVRLVWFYSMFSSAVNRWGTWVGSAFF
jgi:hypothetical protein